MLYGPGDVELCAWGPAGEAAEAAAPLAAEAPVPADWLQRVPRVQDMAASQPVEQAQARQAQPRTSPATRSAIARLAVSPGLSMPKSCTTPGWPWAAGPSMRKSAAGSPGPLSLGRMPV